MDTVFTHDGVEFPLIIGEDRVSDLMVMQSAAGYYIGRCYFDSEFEFIGPYSRESGYMSEEEAVKQLELMCFEVRRCVENNAAYAKGELPHPYEEA